MCSHLLDPKSTHQDLRVGTEQEGPAQVAEEQANTVRLASKASSDNVSLVPMWQSPLKNKEHQEHNRQMQAVQKVEPTCIAWLPEFDTAYSPKRTRVCCLPGGLPSYSI